MSGFESNVEIVSDGTSWGTHVLVNGVEVKGVTRVEIHPVTTSRSTTRATIELIGPKIGRKRSRFALWVHKKLLKRDIAT